jgi:predicted nucleotide-binding protein
MTKPSLVIGSSSEGLEFAWAVRALLDQDAEVTVWKEGFFRLGITYIETLMKDLPRFGFALLVFTPEDLVHSRDVAAFSARDNVIFELGLFMGRLGRERTFILYQADADLKIPTDLSGVTMATYGWPRTDHNTQAAVGAACDSLREVIRALGIMEFP